MTTFATSQIPSEINTVEQLALWVNLVLVAVNANKAVVEADNTLPERIAQVNLFQSPNDGLRHLARINVPMDPAFAADKTKKYWRFATEMTVGTIPTVYTTN
jgi:hypothetical protein